MNNAKIVKIYTLKTGVSAWGEGGKLTLYSSADERDSDLGRHDNNYDLTLKGSFTAAIIDGKLFRVAEKIELSNDALLKELDK